MITDFIQTQTQHAESHLHYYLDEVLALADFIKTVTDETRYHDDRHNAAHDTVQRQMQDLNISLDEETYQKAQALALEPEDSRISHNQIIAVQLRQKIQELRWLLNRLDTTGGLEHDNGYAQWTRDWTNFLKFIHLDTYHR